MSKRELAAASVSWLHNTRSGVLTDEAFAERRDRREPWNQVIKLAEIFSKKQETERYVVADSSCLKGIRRQGTFAGFRLHVRGAG